MQLLNLELPSEIAEKSSINCKFGVDRSENRLSEIWFTCLKPAGSNKELWFRGLVAHPLRILDVRRIDAVRGGWRAGREVKFLLAALLHRVPRVGVDPSDHLQDKGRIDHLEAHSLPRSLQSQPFANLRQEKSHRISMLLKHHIQSQSFKTSRGIRAGQIGICMTLCIRDCPEFGCRRGDTWR